MEEIREKLSKLCWEIIENAIPLEEAVSDLDYLATKELPANIDKIKADMLKIALEIKKDLEKLLEIL